MTFAQFLIALAGVSVAMSAVMTVAWLIWRATRNSGWVDTVWTFGLGLVGAAGALLPFVQSRVWERQLLVAAMCALWALRLGMHIANRTRGITDDPRYAKLVKEWGGNAVPQMFILLQKQALVSIPLALAMVLAAWNPAPMWRGFDIAAIVIMAIAIGGEWLADHQLHEFRSNPANKKKVCDVGLWSWSRHPNYFFETFGWLAYPLIAMNLAGAYPWGWAAWAAPLCIYWLLVHVTGVPPLEEHMLKTRGKAFRDYQKRTNTFFPAPPKQA